MTARRSEEEAAAMAYIITSPCIGTKDRSCVEVCPVDCIHDDGDEDLMLYIDPAECIDCGACEPACPVTAIFAEDDVPDAEKAYTEINALWFKDKEAARNQVLELV
jgi:ferredoxin